MINYKENDKYKFVYQNNDCIAVLIKADDRIELYDCALTMEELKMIMEFILL